MKYLEPSYFFDFENNSIQELISEFTERSLTDKEKTIGLYTRVRDDWKYDPYSISLAKENFRASSIVQKTTGNCVEKSILLIAGLRAMGIPARLHLGKVKNHIAVDRLTEKFGSNELTPHGMVNVFLNKKWLKMSPAFNKSLCEKLNVAPLEFDGENNSFLQAYNSSGTRFMEYTGDYGHFEDVPLEFMKKNIKEHYPHIFDTTENITEFKL
ncbi:MAG: transglutaminase family protein [Bacteroidota bacterium]|uniref:Transglutaminase family protein n=1 Tax=Flagellimonas profundi TaxID=2915620 RepID=A0ABS3FCH7_9FLAO|nr:transglutaminase family protein [Allomuricauda profundi]MBO0340863.1 transglutaminase family protein [Allomuricauda profundi]MEC7771969.1 transglutaminase family protein [Bacteroidota bacterium]